MIVKIFYETYFGNLYSKIPFLESDFNRAAVHVVRDYLREECRKILIVTGEAGMGKTHLVAIALLEQGLTDALCTNGEKLGEEQVFGKCVVVDDADFLFSGSKKWDHLWKQLSVAANGGSKIILTSDDLGGRALDLEHFVVAHIESLNESERTLVAQNFHSFRITKNGRFKLTEDQLKECTKNEGESIRAIEYAIAKKIAQIELSMKP